MLQKGVVKNADDLSTARQSDFGLQLLNLQTAVLLETYIIRLCREVML